MYCLLVPYRFSSAPVRPSIRLSAPLHYPHFFFLYAFDEWYETCWTTSKFPTADHCYTFVASGRHIFENIGFFLSSNRLMFGVFWTKKANIWSVKISCVSITTFNYYNKQMRTVNSYCVLNVIDNFIFIITIGFHVSCWVS